jgi:hypothetical protein
MLFLLMEHSERQSVCEQSTFIKRPEKTIFYKKFLLFENNNFAVCLETCSQDMRPAYNQKIAIFRLFSKLHCWGIADSEFLSNALSLSLNLTIDKHITQFSDEATTLYFK